MPAGTGYGPMFTDKYSEQKRRDPKRAALDVLIAGDFEEPLGRAQKSVGEAFAPGALRALIDAAHGAEILRGRRRR